MLAGAVLFVLGFSVVYVLLGWVSGSVGGWLVEWRSQLEIVLGILTILLGLAFAGLVPFLERDWRVPLGAAPGGSGPAAPRGRVWGAGGPAPRAAPAAPPHPP